MKPLFFQSPEEFRKWLQENHDKKQELIVGFYKVGTKKPSITWSESVDQALCFGWIDGIRKSIDDESYQIRFTPRKPTSIWSAVNIKKVAELLEKGLMHEAGISAFEKRKAEKSGIYSYETEDENLSEEFEEIFKAHKKAWQFFKNLAPTYQRNSIKWIMGAKQESTRRNRLEKIIDQSDHQTNPWKDNKYSKK